MRYNHGVDKDCFQVTRDYFEDRVVVVEGKWVIEGVEVVMINMYAPKCNF